MSQPVQVDVFFPEQPFGGVLVQLPKRLEQLSLHEGSPGPPGPAGPEGPPGNISGMQSGTTPMVAGQPYVDVLFTNVQTDNTWQPRGMTVTNVVDPDPLVIICGTVIMKTTTGFRVLLSGPPDSLNYVLSWTIQSPTGPLPPVEATTYDLSGPSTGMSGVPSDPFTVQLLPGTTLSSPVVITMHDAGDGGTFTPPTVTLSASTTSATFTYTAASSGAKLITTTNSGSLTDPLGLPYSAVAGPLVDGDPVSNWPDSSGNGHDAAMTGSNRPIYKTGITIGSLTGKVVRFSSAGASKLNLAVPITVPSAYTMMAVMKVNAGKSLATLRAGISGGGYGIFEDNGAGNIIALAAPPAGTGYITPNPFTAGAFHLIQGDVNQASAGFRDSSVPVSTSWFAGSSSGSFNTLGYENVTPAYSDGDIAEIILYDHVLSNPDSLNLNRWLSDKYGFGLVAGVPTAPDAISGLLAWYKADAPPT